MRKEGITPKLTPLDAVKAINCLLDAMKEKDCYIRDWENADMVLTHIEYHRADSQVRGGLIKPGVGDKTDNLYCFFEDLTEEEGHGGTY